MALKRELATLDRERDIREALQQIGMIDLTGIRVRVRGTTAILEGAAASFAQP